MGNMLYSFQHKIVKRVISQQCLGCTVSIESIIKEEVEYQDGSTEVRYSTWKTDLNGNTRLTGRFDSCPPIHTALNQVIPSIPYA